MNNIIVSTMPIKPQPTTNIGMLIAPTIAEYLGESLSATTVLATNTLNTYKNKNKELPIYKTDIQKSGIFLNSYFNDQENVKLIMSIIQNMVDQNIIHETKEEIVRCNCGKVDLLKTAVRNFSNGKLYEKTNDGKLICNFCHGECKTYNETVLTLAVNSDYYKEINLVPIFLKKEIQEFEKRFNGSRLLISKTRNTRYYVRKHGKKYYVDIDFIWMNFANLLNEDSKILIASNHQLLKMFVMNYINSVSTKQNLIFIAHPYMINKNSNIDIEKIYHQTEDIYYKKLFLLYQLNWYKKTCNYSESTIKYLSNISNTRRLNLYKAMIELSQNCILSDNQNIALNKMFTYGMNMQNNISYSKKMIKRKES